MNRVIKSIAIVIAFLMVLPSSARNKQGYVVVTDHIKAKEYSTIYSYATQVL